MIILICIYNMYNHNNNDNNNIIIKIIIIIIMTKNVRKCTFFLLYIYILYKKEKIKEFHKIVCFLILI